MTRKKAPQNVLTEAICQSQRMISTKLQTGSEAGSKRQSKSVVEVVDDGVPYDVGWAWMIVLGTYCHFVFQSGTCTVSLCFSLVHVLSVCVSVCYMYRQFTCVSSSQSRGRIKRKGKETVTEFERKEVSMSTKGSLSNNSSRSLS